MKTAGDANSHRYWLGVVSRAHVMIGAEGGFIQLNHGKKAPLQRLRQGDGLAFYSPRESYPDGAPLKAFTAVCIVKDEKIYQADMGDGFLPFRRDVDYLPGQEVSILGLVKDLSFIKNKQSWGGVFRFGFLQIPESDFALIAARMGVRFPGLVKVAA